MTGAAVLAALALPMTAMAENKLVVQDGSSVDKFVVTDRDRGAGTTRQLDSLMLLNNGLTLLEQIIFLFY